MSRQSIGSPVVQVEAALNAGRISISSSLQGGMVDDQVETALNALQGGMADDQVEAALNSLQLEGLVVGCKE